MTVLYRGCHARRPIAGMTSTHRLMIGAFGWRFVNSSGTLSPHSTQPFCLQFRMDLPYDSRRHAELPHHARPPASSRPTKIGPSFLTPGPSRCIRPTLQNLSSSTSTAVRWPCYRQTPRSGILSTPRCPGESPNSAAALNGTWPTRMPCYRYQTSATGPICPIALLTGRRCPATGGRMCYLPGNRKPLNHCLRAWQSAGTRFRFAECVSSQNRAST